MGIKRFGMFLKVLAAVALFCLAGGAEAAEKLNKEGVWTKKIEVNRGAEHTFWVDGLSSETAVWSVTVSAEYTYKDEDNWAFEDWIEATETYTEYDEDDGHTTSIYCLLTEDDWDRGESPPSKLTFTVTVEGNYDSENPENNKFTFHHSSGRGDYPVDVDQDEPEAPKVPEGSDADHAAEFNPKETATPANFATCGSKTGKLYAGSYAGVNTYYLTTSSKLTPGRKYMIGIIGDGIEMGISGDSSDLLANAKSCQDIWPDCTEAYEFVPDSSDYCRITLSGGTSASSFTLRHAVMPSRKPKDHVAATLALDAPEEFSPGYMNAPDSGAFDLVIDEKLFKFTTGDKGDNYLFTVDGADSPLLMHIYNTEGESKNSCTMGTGDDNRMVLAWTAGSKGEVVYVGVCQQLEDGEEPSAGPVTLTATKVVLAKREESLNVIPTTSTASPFDIEGAVPSSQCVLGHDIWTNTFTIAGRKGITYNLKTRLTESGSDNGVRLAAAAYQIVSSKRKELGTAEAAGDSGELDISFEPEENGTVYIDTFVASGDWGTGQGVAYGPYQACAVAAGQYGVLKVDMKGAPASAMGWKILKIDTEKASDESFYPPGSSAILAEGWYTLAAQTVNGFVKPDATSGFGEFEVKVGNVTEVPYKYTDTVDPLDDSPDTKDKLPGTTSAYAPTKLEPTATKPATASRSLWKDDKADWYTIAATAGCYYRLAFAAKDGAPTMAVYGPDNWTDECGYVLFDNPEESLQFCAEKKGTYYVKVSHLDDESRTDSFYTLEATMANPGLVKFAKTDVSVKDSAAYVDLSVSRSGKDGVTRVKFRTVGAQTDKDDAYYYPTNGVLEWAVNDNKAKTVRVRLVPNEAWSTNKVVKVVLEPFDTDDETFDASVEYPATFDVDKKTMLPLDTATITIAASAKKAPGTIQVADSDTPKKPVYTVTAGDTITIPFVRALGADGVVGVKVETVKGTANKSGTPDFDPVVETLVWEDGETDEKTVSVDTKTVESDYTGVKTFTLKLTAVTSGKNDPVQYDKPTIAAASVTVNIVNDKFVDTLANYSKANAAALKAEGITLKEGKAGTWFLDDEGGLFTTAGSDITFTLVGPGKFVFTPEGDGVTASTGSGKTLQTVACESGDEATVYVASGNQSVVIKKASAIKSYVWTQLAAAVAAAPTIDKAVLAKGMNELCFERQDGVSYRVYALSAGQKVERTVNGRTSSVALKLGDPETEIFADGDDRFYVDCEYNTTNNGKYTWRADAYYEDGPVTNVAKTAVNLTILNAEPEDVPATAIAGQNVWGEDIEDLAEGAAIVLRQGVKAGFSVGAAGSTVKSVAGKLPDGLKLEQDKTTKQWYVRGTPTKAGKFQALLQETDAKKVAGTTTVLKIAVEAAGTAVGTFNGLATTFDTTNGVPSLASVTITATAAGKLTAKATIAGKSYSFADTGYTYVAGDPDDPDAPVYLSAELFLATKVVSGKTATTVTNWLYYTVMDVAETNSAGWYAEGVVDILMAALPDAKGSGFQEDVWYSGKTYRNNSRIADKTALAAWQAEAAKYAGYYTVSLVAPDAMPGEPRGSGYMTMTLDAKGNAKLTGKLADGTAYSGSATAAFVGEAESPSIRVPLYAQKGTSVFGGWLSIRENDEGDMVAEIDSPDTDLVWVNDDPASTRAGEEGFVLYLQPVGGWYDTVSNLQRSYLESDLAVNLPEGEEALEEIMDALALGGDYAFVAQPSGQAVDLLGNTLSVAKQTLVKDASKKLNDWDASVNASNVKLTFKRATGIVSGSFDLWYEGTNTKGVEQKSITGLKHEGVLVLMRGDDGYLEDDVLSSGFFLSPQTLNKEVSSGKTTKKVSRKWNGSYRFDIKATAADRVWTDFTDDE
jgi:hypothetical protein